MSESGPMTNPFPGPQPYRAADRRRFHGRETLVKKLTNQLLAHPATTIYGPSGAGKSSLMQAGVIPFLEEARDFRVVRVDAWPPNEEPLSWLVRAIFTDLDLGAVPVDKPTLEMLDQAMKLAEERSEQPILLYLDQLEQLLFSDRTEADAEALLGSVDRLLRARIPGLQIALSLREDYLGRFRHRVRERKELLAQGFRVGPLTVGEMVKAVCQAAANGEPPQPWDEEQLRQLMCDVRVPGEAVSDKAEVQTAYAQIVCRALFQSRARGEDEGNVNAELILRHYLETTLESLGPLGLDARRLLEEHLVTPDGNRTLRTEKELLQIFATEKLTPILEALEGAAILHAEAHQGSRYFELGHDWLAKRVSEQKEQREHEAALRRRDAVQAAAMTRARKRSRIVAMMAITIAVMAGVIGARAHWSMRTMKMAALCVEGALRCAGNRPQRCSGGQWHDLARCESSTCHEGGCIGVCSAGKMRCANNTPQGCEENGQWESYASCKPPTHCQGGGCMVSCTAGVDVGCFGNSPYTCNVDGNFQMTKPCVQSTCYQGICQGVCALDEMRCSASDPKVPETCDEMGQWKTMTKCAGTCRAGSCAGPSCEGLAESCGPGKNENCCVSPVVSGGMFNRDNNTDFPATVSHFRLDRFEVTMGRYRKFVEAYPGSKPRAGAGAHPGIEKSGWETSWDKELPATSIALRAILNNCENSLWTDKPGGHENKRMNCISWYAAFAFCAWDGGRLPTETEWIYAAAGGAEQRVYPWSNPPSSQRIDETYVASPCGRDGDMHACGARDIVAVGSRSPKSDGKWGQADLGGSGYDWVLDAAGAYPSSCNDCANISFTSLRVARGGFWSSSPSHFRNHFEPSTWKRPTFGVRCARAL